MPCSLSTAISAISQNFFPPINAKTSCANYPKISVSEMEDKESELGRPLTEPEQLEILKRRGNPLQVAAGFTPNQGTLAFGPQIIGPVLFPFYVRVLTFNLGLTFLIVGAIFAAISLAGQPIHFADLFSSVILQLFIQLAAVTLIFALVEKAPLRQPHDWSKQDFEKNLKAAIQSRIERKIQADQKKSPASTPWPS